MLDKLLAEAWIASGCRKFNPICTCLIRYLQMHVLHQAVTQQQIAFAVVQKTQAVFS